MTATPSGENFRLSVRVYYEDTDAAGVVYYANYLRFMERARTEWLSAQGFDLPTVERTHGIAFAVRRVDIEYLRPARLGDRLDVTFRIVSGGRASFVADQAIRRAEETLTQARVTVACLARQSWRPTRIPAEIAAHMESAA
jgi:acyl-CoA thioester hydrolase